MLFCTKSLSFHKIYETIKIELDILLFLNKYINMLTLTEIVNKKK